MDSPTQTQDSDGILEIDTLKQFTIPKRKKAKKDLFENLALDSREYLQDILHVMRLSYKDRESIKHFSYSRPRLVHNDLLMDEYAEKKKRMRQDGYAEKELQDIYGFLHVETEQEARKICRDGLRIGNSSVSCLGNPKMGVYLCKHADIITPEPLKSRKTGTLVLLKLIKGKVKFMVENRSGVPLEPSPNFDCHVLKTSNIDMSASSPQYVYECTQLYMYEYKEDSEISDRPRQIYPFATVDFRFQGMSSRDASRLGPPVLQQQMKAQTASKKSWAGKEAPVLSHLEPQEIKKSRHKSGEASGSKNAPQLSPNMPKLDTKRNGSTVEKDGSVAAGQALMKDAVIWSGELSCGAFIVSQVKLLSLSLPFKPSGLRKVITVDRKVSLINIKNQYFQSLKRLDPKVEEEADGTYYFYAYLVPSTADVGAFKKFVEYLTSSETGLINNLDDDSQIIMMPDCDISQELGLAKDSSVGLHCVVLLKHSMSERIKDETEKQLQLPDQIESKSSTSLDGTSGIVTDEEKTTSAAGVETSLDENGDQSSDNPQSRDPRLRSKMRTQSQTPKAPDATRKRPLVVSHSRLVTVFDEMSKLQDKSNIELARMIKMSRHNNTSSSQSSQQPSPMEPGQSASVSLKPEASEMFSGRSSGLASSSGMGQGPTMPPGHARPLLCPPDQGGPHGSGRPQMPPDNMGFHNPWMRRWPGNAPQQGPPNRPNQFSGPPTNGMFGGWGQQYTEPPYPPGPEFKAAPNKAKEMLSPRAWAELHKKGKGREVGQRPQEPRSSGPPAEFSSHPNRRKSDSRNTGHQGEYPGHDSGRYMGDQWYGGYPGDFAQDPNARHPGGNYQEPGMYDSNRWLSDSRTGGYTGDHLLHDFNRWPTDPRQGVSGEYPSTDSDWWMNDPRSHGDRSNQGLGMPASNNNRPALLGDYPDPEPNYCQRSGDKRISEPLEEHPSRNINRSDPRVARLSQDSSGHESSPRLLADPRTLRPRNSAEANQSLDNLYRSNHSSGTVRTEANISSSEQS